MKQKKKSVESFSNTTITQWLISLLHLVHCTNLHTLLRVQQELHISYCFTVTGNMALQSKEKIEKYLILYCNFGCISTFEVYTYIYIEMRSTLMFRSTLNKAA